MSALDRPTPAVVADVATGEVLDLNAAATDELASYIARVRDLEGELRAAKRAVTAELLERMDRQAQWTVVAGEWKVSGDSPAPRVTYDAEALAAELQMLVDADLLAPNAAAKAVERVVSWKVSQAGVNALVKLGGAVADAVARHRVEETRERRVSVRPAGVR